MGPKVQGGTSDEVGGSRGKQLLLEGEVWWKGRQGGRQREDFVNPADKVGGTGVGGWMRWEAAGALCKPGRQGGRQGGWQRGSSGC